MLEERANTLKPMTVSEILDNTFRIYGKNILAILVFSALIGGAFMLIMGFVTNQMMPADALLNQWTDLLENPNVDPEIALGSITDSLPELFAFQGTLFLFSLISAIFIKPFVQGGIINVTYNDVRGNRLGVKKSLVSTLKRFWRLVLTSLSLIPYYIGVGIVLIILTIIFLIPLVLSGGALSNDPTGGKIAGFVFLLFITIVLMAILAIMAGVFIIFTFHAAATEENYGFKAIGRSFKLVGKKFWRSLGVTLLIYLIIGIIGAIVTFVSSITSLVSPSNVMASYATGFIMTAFVMPVAHIASTLLFIDIRARVDGPIEVEEVEPWDGIERV